MIEVHLDASSLERARMLVAKLPLVLKEAMRKANINSSAHILERIKRVKLVGGNPLNRRTGNLIRSWAVIPPVDEGDGWRGGVGSNCSYAAAHEFGVDKTQNVAVRAHSRKQISRNVGSRKGEGKASGVAFVSAHTRAQHTKLPARPYARPSLHESMDRIRATHHDQIRQAWEKSK